MKKGQSFTITSITFIGLLLLAGVLLVIFVVFYSGILPAAGRWATENLAIAIQSVINSLSKWAGSLFGSIVPGF